MNEIEELLPPDALVLENESILGLGVIIRDEIQMYHRLDIYSAYKDKTKRSIAMSLMNEYTVGNFPSYYAYIHSAEFKYKSFLNESYMMNLAGVHKRYTSKLNLYEIIGVSPIKDSIYGFQQPNSFDVVLKNQYNGHIIVFNVIKQYDLRNLFITCSRKFLLHIKSKML